MALLRTTYAPRLEAIVAPGGDLGAPKPANALPEWARRTRDWLLELAPPGSPEAIALACADSHELVAITEEALDLPDDVFQALYRQARDAKT